jgi:hypothetical protein
MYGNFVLGTTSSVSGLIQLSLPVTAQNSALGNFFATQTVSIEDPGQAIYFASAYFVSSSTIAITTINAASTYAKDGGTSATVPMTWASGDKINISMVYEAA